MYNTRCHNVLSYVLVADSYTVCFYYCFCFIQCEEYYRICVFIGTVEMVLSAAFTVFLT